MTDIPRGQGGDGSPQLDLDAIERQARIQQNIRAHLRDCDAENDVLRGRVEELTEALRALSDACELWAGEDMPDDLTLLRRRVARAIAPARTALARVVPEKETP